MTEPTHQLKLRARFGDHAGALALCQPRFKARELYWTHAARLGAELAIRLEPLPLATEMFKAVIDAKAVPWARLGIARVMDASGKDTAAVSTIKNLLGSYPTCADAYYVLGRIYTGRGDYAAAADTFRRAVGVTPHSVARNQKHGILVDYTGDQRESMKVLSQVVERGGLLSPDFDQYVILLTAQAEVVRAPGAPAGQAWVLQRRLLRYLMLVDALAAVPRGDAVLAMERLEENFCSLAERDAAVDAPIAFLLALSTVCGAQVQMPMAHVWVHTVGLRYCTNKQVTEPLARTCEAFQPLADPVREARVRINEMTRAALALRWPASIVKRCCSSLKPSTPRATSSCTKWLWPRLSATAHALLRPRRWKNGWTACVHIAQRMPSLCTPRCKACDRPRRTGIRSPAGSWCGTRGAAAAAAQCGQAWTHHPRCAPRWPFPARLPSRCVQPSRTCGAGGPVDPSSSRSPAASAQRCLASTRSVCLHCPWRWY